MVGFQRIDVEAMDDAKLSSIDVRVTSSSVIDVRLAVSRNLAVVVVLIRLSAIRVPQCLRLLQFDGSGQVPS